MSTDRDKVPGAAAVASGTPERTLETDEQVEVNLASTGLPLSRRLMLSPSLSLAVAIALFVVYGITQSSQFTNSQTWVNILRDASFTAIPAAFGAAVLISGGLDLSVGSVFVTGSMVSAELAIHGWPVVAVVLVAIAVGGAVGLLNGLLINLLNIPPIIVTLGTLFSVRAMVTYLSKGNSIGPVPAGFGKLGQGSALGVPYVVYLAVGVGVLAHIMLNTSTFGWNIRAAGGNREGARSAGINVRRVSVAVYVLSGSAAAFAGLLQASWLGSSSPSLGTGLELTVIAAAIIGGTSIAGAIGTVFGAMLGALLLSVLGTGLVLLQVDPSLQDFFTGLVLVLAAALDQLRRRQMFQTSVRRTRGAG